MGLATRLRLMVIAAVTACVAAVVALFALVNSVSGQYEGVLAGTVQASQDARVMQVTFKKQVQEWKDILLRGSNPADLQTYTQQFKGEEKAVQDLATRLDDNVPDPRISAEIRQFRDQHSVLSAKYHNALDAFVASGGTDFKAADAAVRGQDRPPTDLVDKIVSDLHNQQVRLIAAEKREVARDEIIVIAVGTALIVALLAGLHYAARGIVGPVRRATAVLGEVAAGNLTVSMTGSYDGEFDIIKESINTAVEDLNSGLNRVVSAADRIADTSRFVETVSDQLIHSAQITRVSLDAIEHAVLGINSAEGPATLNYQIAEVRRALAAMAPIADRNVAAAEDARRATDELRANSDNLQWVVAAYKLKPVDVPAWATAHTTPVAQLTATAQ